MRRRFYRKIVAVRLNLNVSICRDGMPELDFDSLGLGLNSGNVFANVQLRSRLGLITVSRRACDGTRIANMKERCKEGLQVRDEGIKKEAKEGRGRGKRV